MKKIRILFQGDSITDAGRDKRNYFDLGNGYPKYSAENLKKAYPDVDFEFINLGISGNRTDQLFDRLYPDAISLQPDVISILIGVNDVWHRHGASKIMTTDEQFELNYRTILRELKAKTNAKIMILVPFALDYEDEMREHIKSELPSVQKIVYELAEEFADVCIPLDKLFGEAVASQPEPLWYSGDGVHPNANGAAFIGEHYANYIAPIIEELK